MTVLKETINNKKAKEKRIKLFSRSLSKCNLKLFENPVISDYSLGYGPTVLIPDNDKEVYDNFINTMEKTLSGNDLTTMHNNMDRLILKKSYVAHIPKSCINILKGRRRCTSEVKYNSLVNTLSINGNIKRNQQQLITRELLHMSSSNINGIVIYSGLSQRVGNQIVCHGLSAGYTELLNEKIFGGKNIQPNHFFLKECSRLIENLIGEKRMQHLYFTNNVKELRDYLAEYTSINEVNGFLLDLDLIHSNTKYYKRAIGFLTKLYDNKIIHDIEKGCIDNPSIIRNYSFLRRELELLELAGKANKNVNGYIKQIKKVR